MKHLGNLELSQSSQILGNKTESLSTAPDFIEVDESRLIYNTGAKTLQYNNGTEWKTLLSGLDATSSVVRNTFGSDLANADLSFNPTAINELDNIDGLNGNSGIYDVIVQLDAAITSQLSNLIGGVTVNLTDLVDNEILFYDGSEFVNGPLSGLIGELEININQLNNVTLEDQLENDILIFRGGVWNNTRLFYKYDDTSGLNSTFSITHSIGQKYCHVDIIDRSTSTESIIDPSLVTSIVFTDENTIDVTLTETKAVSIIVTGLQQS